MATVNTELISLAGLGAFAEEAKKTFATVEALQAVSTKANSAVQKVKVNDVEVTAVSNEVNLTAVTGTTNGTILIAGQAVPVKGLAALAYLATVGEDQLATALKDKINGAVSDIGILKGAETVDGSVKKTVADAIEAFTTLTTQNDQVDTFKEMVMWVAEHGTAAAALTSTVQSLEAMLDGIGGDGEATTVVGAIEEALEEIGADADTIAQIDTNKAAIAALVTLIGASSLESGTNNTNILTRIGNLDIKVQKNETDIATIMEALGLTEDGESEAGTVLDRLESVEGDVTALKSKVDGWTIASEESIRALLSGTSTSGGTSTGGEDEEEEVNSGDGQDD